MESESGASAGLNPFFSSRSCSCSCSICANLRHRRTASCLLGDGRRGPYPTGARGRNLAGNRPPEDRASMEPLVTTEWLEAHLHDPDLRVVDIRGYVTTR